MRTSSRTGPPRHPSVQTSAVTEKIWNIESYSVSAGRFTPAAFEQCSKLPVLGWEATALRNLIYLFPSERLLDLATTTRVINCSSGFEWRSHLVLPNLRKRRAEKAIPLTVGEEANFASRCQLHLGYLGHPANYAGETSNSGWNLSSLRSHRH